MLRQINSLPGARASILGAFLGGTDDVYGLLEKDATRSREFAGCSGTATGRNTVVVTVGRDSLLQGIPAQRIPRDDTFP